MSPSNDDKDRTEVFKGPDAPDGDRPEDGRTEVIGERADPDRTEVMGDRSALDDGEPVDPDATVMDDGASIDNATDRDDATVVDRREPGNGVPRQRITAPIPAGAMALKQRFILEERLGRGGMGQVYKARDLRKVEAQDDNPWVAIKILGEEFSRHPKALISLQREAKKSQQLAHPNVVTVYDFDRDGDRVFMTMELLQGAPLSGWKEIDYAEGRRPSPERMVKEMAAGLAYAHKFGVVHSDFKPDNVFVTTDGRVKILDFGIARIVDSAVEKDSFDAGELGALTLGYASLEMLQGGNEPHPADDVYALGLTAYILFSGKHPFDGKHAVEAMNAGMTPEPLRNVKRHQWKAIAGALQFERKDRIASAELFLKQFSGKTRRNRLLIAAVVALALSSGYFAWQATRPEGPAVPFAQLPLERQQQITRNLELGRQSAEIQDWDGASRYFLAAYALHPRNADAEKGLDLLAERLIEMAPTLEHARQKQYLLTMIDGYGENEYLANHPGLMALRERLENELEAEPAG
ncbi:serine/threonine-protein kinase [Halomonas denitrificans]|nr:serine/threonine protein kinase [Halomonas denitrificans]